MAARARTLALYVPHLWPDDDVVLAWLSENWAAWNAKPPKWFTQQWRDLLQKGWRDGPLNTIEVARQQLKRQQNMKDVEELALRQQRLEDAQPLVEDARPSIDFEKGDSRGFGSFTNSAMERNFTC